MKTEYVYGVCSTIATAKRTGGIKELAKEYDVEVEE